MSTTPTTNTSARRVISGVVVLAILGIFLSIYFLKYVPEQKHDYNRRAFVELGSVTDAFTRRHQAYLQVANHLMDDQSPNAIDEVLRVFPNSKFIKNCPLTRTSQKSDSALGSFTADTEFDRDSLQQWNLAYTVNLRPNKKNPVCGTLHLLKPIDSLMLPLISGDNDVFDTYLLILDSSSTSAESTRRSKGEIIFNPGQLSLDYLVSIDTLLKKSDGFSLPGINNVTIEGNEYKLFLYPFRLHKSRAIMAGLLGKSRYTQKYESVPVAFITTGAILFLLLLVALPLLKIYIIGPGERITNFDLRLVIAAYFVGGFVLFFLFAWNFLVNTQTQNNKSRLKSFAHVLQDSLTAEIHYTCAQLRKYDTLYWSDTNIQKALSAQPYDPDKITNAVNWSCQDIHPTFYKQFDLIFWVANNAVLNGRYARMRYRDIPLVSVADRDYFKDMQAGRVLTLPTDDRSVVDSFCLQPTLDKLDGRYVVNIVIPSHARKKDDKAPIMVGSSGQPYSIFNNALPPGYGFSIVDNKGTILFDSRKGRHLLSNIASDINDDGSIAQCINFRKERFFSSVPLHGSNSALLVSPLGRLPYVALVYYELNASDKFTLYILGLTAFFVGSIILLLIFSAYCNEWANIGTSLSGIPPIDFDWLRPKPCKQSYYRQLLLGMGMLATSFGLIWFWYELFGHRQEFALFVITVLFPFYLAIHYFLLREKQKKPMADLRRRIPKAALAIPLLAIVVIMIFVLCNLSVRNIYPVLAAQLLFFTVIKSSLDGFYPTCKLPPTPDVLRDYSRAIMTGVITIIVIPAMGIFCFFYKEETRTASKEEMLAFASTIEARKNYIEASRDTSHYFSDNNDPGFLNNLENHKGIYYIGNSGPSDPIVPDQDLPVHHASMYYGLRNFLYPGDTTILTFGENPDRAGDSSWFFAPVRSDSELLVHMDRWSGRRDSVRLPLSAATRQSALKLLITRADTLADSSRWLFILTVVLLVTLFLHLTSSLATRIFLLRILTTLPRNEITNKYLADAAITSPFASALINDINTETQMPWSAASLRQFEHGNLNFRSLQVRGELDETYKILWTKLSTEEKFVLYDFALDGLTNYKAGTPLFNLIQKGVLYIDRDWQLRFMTDSFRIYVINQAGTKVILQQLKRAKLQGSWQRFRVPVLLVIAAAGIFVFLTQEAVYQKITGLFTSLSTLLPLITQFFDKGNK